MTAGAADGWTDARARDFLRTLFEIGVSRADPAASLAACLPDRPSGRCVVVGAGKAAATMAAAVEAAWPDVDLTGVVVVPHGQERPLARIAVVGAAHPVPDAASENAARKVLAAVQGLSGDDLVLALVSGGGSALLALPAAGLTLADKRAVNRALLRSGATIAEMNAVRRRLSAIKGGRLAAAAAPARVVTLVISDVPGDDPATIASGPTIPPHGEEPDPVTVVERYALDLPAAVREVLARPTDEVSATAAPDVRMVAAPVLSLRAMAEAAEAAGVRALVLGDAIEGEAREVATMHAGIARAVRRHGLPVATPAVLLSGGETTVSIGKGPAGQGGRNTEFILALGLALGGAAGIWALAADGDGIDGASDAAGAFLAPGTVEAISSAGLDPRGALAGHDCYRALAAAGALLVTGPTGTNANDLRMTLVTGASDTGKDWRGITVPAG